MSAEVPSQPSGEQLELQDELDAQEGFDGWDVFDEAREMLARKAIEEAEAA